MHKKLYKSLLLIATVLLFATGCTNGNQNNNTDEKTTTTRYHREKTTEEATETGSNKEKNKTTITSDTQEITLEVGETKPLSYTITGGDGNPALDFQTGDANKLYVDFNGNITGVADGTTYVVAKCDGVECYWNVTIIPAGSVNSDTDENIEMYVGDSQNIAYTVDGGDGSYVPVVTKGDESIVAVSEDESSDNKNYALELTAVGAGSTTITVQYGDVAKRSWNITVKPQEDSLPDGEYGIDVENVEADGNYLILHFPEKDWGGSVNSYNGKTYRIEVSKDGEFLWTRGVNAEGEVLIEQYSFDEWTHTLAPGIEFTIKDNKIVKIWGKP